MSFWNVGINVEPNVKPRCDCEELYRKGPRKLLRIRPEIFVFDPDLFSLRQSAQYAAMLFLKCVHTGALF